MCPQLRGHYSIVRARWLAWWLCLCTSTGRMNSSRSASFRVHIRLRKLSAGNYCTRNTRGKGAIMCDICHCWSRQLDPARRRSGERPGIWKRTLRTSKWGRESQNTTHRGSGLVFKCSTPHPLCGRGTFPANSRNFFNKMFPKSNSRKFRPAKYKRHTVAPSLLQRFQTSHNKTFECARLLTLSYCYDSSCGVL